MLISEFARRASLGVDTVRHYIRAGILTPETGTRGGRNPYQEFSEDDLRVAYVIRFGQALGMSLKDIAAVLQAGADSQIETLIEKRDALRQRGDELFRLADYLDEKIAWLEGGASGRPPRLDPRDIDKAPPAQCQ